MRIEVTQEDIDNGERESCRLCPIALAAGRVTRKYITVGRTTVLIGSGHRPLPGIARDFIRNYDDGKSVSPFSFDIPDQEATNGH